MEKSTSDRLTNEQFIPAEELFDLLEAQLKEKSQGLGKEEIQEIQEAIRLAREFYQKDKDPDHMADEALGVNKGDYIIENDWFLVIAEALQTGDASDLVI